MIFYPPPNLWLQCILSIVLYLSWFYHYISWWFTSLTQVIFNIPNCHRGSSFYVFLFCIKIYQDLLVGLFFWKVLISESILISASLLLYSLFTGCYYYFDILKETCSDYWCFLFWWLYDVFIVLMYCWSISDDFLVNSKYSLS